MKGKFVKKLIACALAVSMVVSIPFTASAADFKDFFWISDGNEEHDKERDPNGIGTGTGTVTSTATHTTILTENMPEIKKIVIEPPVVRFDLSFKNTQELTARIVYNNESVVSDVDKKKIEKFIQWKTSDLNILRPSVSYSDRTKCSVKAYRGGAATITAYLDTDYDGVPDFEGISLITVTKQFERIELKRDKFYAGHTYDLMKYVGFVPEDAYGDLRFALDGLPSAQKKLVTLDDGILKVGKVKNEFTAKLKVTEMVNGNTPVEKGSFDVTIGPGVPVTGWNKVTTNMTKVDILDEYKDKDGKDSDTRNKKQYPVKVDPKTRSGITTDDITWTSSNPQVVKMIIPEGKSGITEKDGEPLTEVFYEAVAPGKAQIIATATSGKSTKINVTVLATLREIKSASVEPTYTGKATAVKVVKIPAENQDKLKINIPRETKGLKAKAAITPIIIPEVDFNKINVSMTIDGSKETKTIKGITVASSKNKNIVSETFNIAISQSDVVLNKVTAVNNPEADDLDKKTVKLHPGDKVPYYAMVKGNNPNDPVLARETVSWETSKETVATVDGGMVTVVGEGTAKITASSVYLDKGKYKVSKKSFTIKSAPECEQIIFKADKITVDRNSGKKVVVNISQQVPKKANDTVTWYILDRQYSWIKVSSGIDGDKTDKQKGIDNKKFTFSSGDLSKLNYDSNTIILKARVNNPNSKNVVEAEAKIILK